MIQIIFHWFNYTRPNEQRQIVRIIQFPMVFGFCNFLALWRYPASPYLTQLAEFYEIFALAGMFLLLTYYVCPDPSMYESYFAHLPRVNRRGKPIHDRGSLRWFYYSWVMVFQVSEKRQTCTPTQSQPARLIMVPCHRLSLSELAAPSRIGSSTPHSARPARRALTPSLL